jgi:hypothetical protein
MDHLNSAEKKLLHDIKDKEDNESEDNGSSENFQRESEGQQPQQTHNGCSSLV